MKSSSSSFEQVFGFSAYQIGSLIAGLLGGLLSAALLPDHPFLGFTFGFTVISVAGLLFSRHPVVSLSLLLIASGIVVLMR